MSEADICRKSINHLENIIGVFEKELGKPQPVRGAFTYESPHVKHVCFLKGARIVSGLNALLVLLHEGYLTEMGVLVRTVSDCINDIYFLLENFPKITPEVDKYVSNFFNDIIEEPEIDENDRKRTHRIKVRKIHASRARLLSEHMNLQIDRDMVYRIYSAYSGYVHAAYPNIMEMYGGSPEPRFHLRGMKKMSRVKDWRQIVLEFIRSSILVFGYMAEKYGDEDIVQEIRRTLDQFEKESHVRDNA
jgi:hypothetical protein